MTKLIHLSDLHFGAHDPRLVAAVEARVDAEKPDLVVISGDFTQRARTAQFEEACAFLDRLRNAGHEVLAVPGNHDVPLYDVLRRFLSPLTRYRKYIDDTLCPFHELPGAKVLGINTARSATFKDGRINHEQIAFIRETFAKTDINVPRVLVTHHPLFALPTGDGIGKPIDNQADVLDMIASIGVDVLLAGHNHRASHQDSADFVTKSTGALVIQAGTATSTRVRGE
ncbi:MAG: metallophosphoesterase, partial [Sphingomicrobium sp.]